MTFWKQAGVCAVIVAGSLGLGGFFVLTLPGPALAQAEDRDPGSFWESENRGTTPGIAWPQLPTPSPAASAAIAPSEHPPGPFTMTFPDYRLPASLTLCGEALPLNQRFVFERLEFEFLQVVNNRAQVRLWFRRGARYFPIIEAKLKAAGLPDDLKYLAVAESDLRPSIVSPSGALGLWQFMPGTAKKFGLTVSKAVDERHLPEPLLDIGLAYLSQLHDQFGSWSLAMAGYNSGENRVARALAKQGVRDYYNLELPRETERYIYRIAAIKAIMENPAAYGFADEVPPSWRVANSYEETKIVFVQACPWGRLAELTSCDYKTIRRLNPHLSGSTLTGGPVRLRVPLGQADSLAQKLQ